MNISHSNIITNILKILRNKSLRKYKISPSGKVMEKGCFFFLLCARSRFRPGIGVCFMPLVKLQSNVTNLICARFMAEHSQHSFYKLVPLKLGCEVHGIQVGSDVAPEIIEAIKKDVTKHRILVFR